MTESVTIVGSTVGSLTAALAAARRGRSVNLYLDPARIGGSFGGLRAGGRRFDIGSRLFELDYEGSDDRPITAFDPDRDGHRPFIAAVARFIRELLGDDLEAAPVPEMAIAGRRTRCALMTVDLSQLPAALSPADRRLVRDQVGQILAAMPGSAASAEQTLCEASLAQHGARLHALLTEAVCAKQHAGWQAVPASDRRKLWAALFSPRTIFEAFAGLPIGFRPHRPFSTTSAGVAYPLVDHLYRAVQDCDRIAVIPAGPVKQLSFDRAGAVRIRFAGLPELRLPGEQCAIGDAPEQVFAAAGLPYKPERITTSILWVDVAESDVDDAPSALTVCDPELPVLRISGAGSMPGARCFAIEFGCLPPTAAAAAAALRQTGVVRRHAVVKPVHQVSGPAQTVPSAANRQAFEAARTVLAAFRGTLLGGARRFGFDGLNDQIADALYFGATRC